ncbi:MAG: DUF3576 domain-containing protein [Dongiaceae bacterium]
MINGSPAGLGRHVRAAALIAAAIALSSLSACSWWQTGEANYPAQRSKANRGVDPSKPNYEQPESIFGPGGLTLLGGSDQKNQPQDGSSGGIGVNSFLWRASLDTVAFMPLVSADPFGGVIITDWYSPPQSPNERFKVNVFILGRTLRADGVRTAVFRQQMASAGWVDAPVAPTTATDLENAILVRARQLRIAQGGGQ